MTEPTRAYQTCRRCNGLIDLGGMSEGATQYHPWCAPSLLSAKLTEGQISAAVYAIAKVRAARKGSPAFSVLFDQCGTFYHEIWEEAEAALKAALALRQ